MTVRYLYTRAVFENRVSFNGMFCVCVHCRAEQRSVIYSFIIIILPERKCSLSDTHEFLDKRYQSVNDLL